MKEEKYMVLTPQLYLASMIVDFKNTLFFAVFLQSHKKTRTGFLREKRPLSESALVPCISYLKHCCFKKKSNSTKWKDPKILAFIFEFRSRWYITSQSMPVNSWQVAPDVDPIAVRHDGLFRRLFASCPPRCVWEDSCTNQGYLKKKNRTIELCKVGTHHGATIATFMGNT